MTRNSARDTGVTRLPALPWVRTGDQALDRWIQAVSERLEVREGARGNPYERAVTLRELEDMGLALTPKRTLQGGAAGPGGVLVRQPDGNYTTMTPGAFADSLRESRLFQSLTRKLDDVARFDEVPAKVREIILLELAEEARRRGAEIRRLEEKLQSDTQSLAYTVQEVTAAVDSAAAGVRDTTFAVAEANRAVAGKVEQVVARLDGVGGVTIEESVLAVADRVAGLAGEYMVKVTAGGAVAGFGLAASEDPSGATESSFIVQADKFAVVTGTDSIPDPKNPPLNRVPFGVDASGVYINGQLRVNAGGSTLTDLANTAGTPGVAGQSITATATSQVFAINNNNVATPDSIICSVIRPPALQGAAANGDFVWTLVNGSSTKSLATINSNTGAFGALSPSDITSDAATFRCTYTVNRPGDPYNGMSFSDDITITKVRQGVGVSTFLTNESHTVPADKDGIVTDWAGAGGTFKVYSGTTDVTGSCTFSIVTNPSNLAASIVANTGVFTVTGAGSWANSSSTTTLTLRATYNHPVTGSASYDKVFTLSKSKAGVNGTNGTNGANGANGSRGSLTLYASGTAWSDATANNAVTAASGSSTRVIGDTVTISNGTSFAATKYWSGTAWVSPGVVIDGNLLVSGTVSADKIASNSITAGTVSTEKVRITAAGSYFASGSANLSVVDGTATVSVACSIGTPLYSWAASDISGVAMSLVWYDHNGTTAFFRLNAWHRATGLPWTGTLPVLRIWVY